MPTAPGVRRRARPPGSAAGSRRCKHRWKTCHCRTRRLAAGWTMAATYLLPDTDWAAYYDPLAARIAQLRRERPADGVALDEVEHEIEVRRTHGRDYGYTGYVLRPR